MIRVGDFIDGVKLAELAGAKNAHGTQCGILVNEKIPLTLLTPKLPGDLIQNYSNRWDPEIIGLLYFFGTNKGLNKMHTWQNMETKLNKSVNESLYPMHVYVRYPGQRYRFMGEFIRIPKYDEWVELDGKYVKKFGLISKNIEAVEPIIKEMIKTAI